MRPVLPRASVLTLSATLACTPLPTQECVLCDASGVVYGRVTTSHGAPVAKANVYAWISNVSCGSLVAGQAAAHSATDVIGYYHAEPQADAGTRNACVTVRVVAPPGSGLQDTVLRGGFMDLGIPRDSLRVDIALSATP